MSLPHPFLPLQNTLIVELGTGYVAPLASMYLGFLGATVIKIENRDNPDFMRGDLRSGPGLSPSFIDANRGKRSVVINAKTKPGLELMKALVSRADIFLENLGSGVVSRLGFGFPAVRALNDKIVMVSMQGLGAAISNSTTLGQNLPPLIGLTHLWNLSDADKPVGSQLFHPDYFAGLQCAALALIALGDSRRTGKAHRIDCAQAEVAASLLGPQYLACQINGAVAPLGNIDLSAAPSGCYPCKGEDVWVYINVRDDRQWAKMAKRLSEDGNVVDERYDSLLGRLRGRSNLDERLRKWTSQHTASAILADLKSDGITCCHVQDVNDLECDARFAFNDFTWRMEHQGFAPIVVPGMPLQISGNRIRADRTCPGFGEHTRLVLREQLGMDDADVDALIAERVIEDHGRQS